jgi:hypothetical protein
MKGLALEAKATVEAEVSQIRSQESMRHDTRRKTPDFPTLKFGSGEQPVEADKHSPRLQRNRVKHFLPTMSAAKYAEHKARLIGKQQWGEKSAIAQQMSPTLATHTVASRSTHTVVGSSGAATAVAPATLAPAVLAPAILIGPDIEGAVDVDGVMPPDTHGALGLQEFVEVTNMHIDIFQRADPTQRTSVSLAAFFGYFTQALFDPRAVYDSAWNRWVITADAFPESPTVQYHFIATSTTSSASSPFFVYAVNVAFNSGDFWDYPQLGMDQDSVIITANIFDASFNFKGADMFSIAKARLYNGLGFSVPVFQGLEGTLAPPMVLDQNANTFLIAAPGGNTLKLYTLTNSSHPTGISLSGPADVTVDSYAGPPPASQPGTSALLDTLDGRFVNASTQIGDFLWQVHTINLVGFAAPKFYQVNTATASIVQSGFFFASGSSFDFNASIAANSDNDVFLTWTSTDPPAGIEPEVRFAGCDHNDGPAVPGAGTATFTSPTSFGGGRWGDYSAVTIDPMNTRQAWLVNEDVTAIGDWGSRIDGIGF